MGAIVTERPQGPLGTQGATPDFASLFRLLPSPYMVLDRNLHYVDANDAYCAVLERRREDLIGVYLFDAFPEPGESGRRLMASLQRVLETGQSDALPLIPYAIERPAARGGGFEMRFWSAVHVPLLGPDGRTQFIVQNTVDVTELQKLKALAFGPDPAPGEKDILLRVQEVQAENQSLLRETQGLRDLFMQAPGFMVVIAGPDLRFALVNTAFQDLIGHRAAIGRTVDEVVPEVRAQGFIDLLEDVMARCEPYVGQSIPVRLRRTEAGPLEERFVDFVFQPIVAPDGTVSGVFVEGSDVTARVHAERQQKLLVDELNHRVKNSLATVQAIAQQTLRTASDPASFQVAFESRLMALSQTHDLLTATNWRGAALRDVLLAELGPFGASRYGLEGPAVDLTPSEALAFGLVAHELATNAAKYGALSTEGGTVSVSWTVADAQLSLAWIERGGPRVDLPYRRGFGSRLIERSLQGPLAGEAHLEFIPDGLVCRIALPLAGG